MAGKGFGRCLTESVRLRDIRNLAAPLRSFHREVNSQIVKLDLKPTHLTHHLWGEGAPALAPGRRFSRRKFNQ
jgi:hypothetical protein